MERFISGVPRAGKTKRAVIEIIDLLRNTHMPIATNIALELNPWVDGAGISHKGLLRGLFDKYGSDFGARERIYLLSKEQVTRFYAWRPLRGKLWDTVSELPGDTYGQFTFDGDHYASVAYFIDEAHVPFPSAAVVEKARMAGPEVLGYASQCGRCGDLVFFISQVLMNVDKRLRGVAQECWWMTNHVHQQFGMFRQADKISFRVYGSVPPTPGQQWLAKGTLHYDRTLIDGAYDTGKGVGVSGSVGADIGRRAKGIPIKWIWVAILLCAIGAWTAYYAVKVSAQKYFAMGKAAQAAEHPPAAFSAAQLAQLDRMLANAGEQAARKIIQFTNLNTHTTTTTTSNPNSPTTNLPTIKGWTKGQNGYAIVWNDGQVSLANSLQEKGRQLIIDGQPFERTPPPPPKEHKL